MPILELKTYVRVVAVVFSISSATAFVMALLRLLNPELYYLNPLGSREITHYAISGLMIVSSAIGFLNSCVVMHRSAERNTGRNVTVWLLLDSLFETSRVVYVFVCAILLEGKGTLQHYELLISIVQYLVDSFFYCQMILRH